MRQIFGITFLGNEQTLQTIAVNSEEVLEPMRIDEYRGEKGEEIYWKSHQVTETVGLGEEVVSVEVNNG